MIIFNPLKKRALCAGFLAIASISSEASSNVQGTIAEMTIDKNFGSFVFVRFATVPTNKIGCSVNGYWHFTLPLVTDVDKRMFAVLMTARATGAVVKATGSGGCNEVGSIESLQAIGM